jgi:hypothetical protein
LQSNNVHARVGLSAAEAVLCPLADMDGQIQPQLSQEGS